MVAAGADAQALIGVPVYVMGGKMLGQYVTLDASLCVPIGTPSDASASSADDYYIDRCSLGNPLTILGFLYTMKQDGHKAIVHTAAASNLGRMLVRLCRKLNIPLVNVVRRDEQVKLLKEVEGAEHVLNSTSPTFRKELVAACVATGATCCFDATGGGKLGGYALTAMEQAVVIREKPVYSRYGTETLKSLYIYGGLDQSPTTYARTFGFAYKIEGWLIIKVLKDAGMKEQMRMMKSIVDEVASGSGVYHTDYSERVDLKGMLQAENVRRFAAQATGDKYVVMPNSNQSLGGAMAKL